MAAARGPKQTKQPFLHRLKDGEPFAMAGLWTVAQPKDADEPIASCAVVTTSANRDVSFVNHRMPVVLDGPAAEHAWLDPDVDLSAAITATNGAPARALGSHPARGNGASASPSSRTGSRS